MNGRGPGSSSGPAGRGRGMPARSAEGDQGGGGQRAASKGQLGRGGRASLNPETKPWVPNHASRSEQQQKQGQPQGSSSSEEQGRQAVGREAQQAPAPMTWANVLKQQQQQQQQDGRPAGQQQGVMHQQKQQEAGRQQKQQEAGRQQKQQEAGRQQKQQEAGGQQQQQGGAGANNKEEEAQPKLPHTKLQGSCRRCMELGVHLEALEEADAVLRVQASEADQAVASLMAERDAADSAARKAGERVVVLEGQLASAKQQAADSEALVAELLAGHDGGVEESKASSTGAGGGGKSSSGGGGGGGASASDQGLRAEIQTLKRQLADWQQLVTASAKEVATLYDEADKAKEELLDGKGREEKLLAMVADRDEQLKLATSEADNAIAEMNRMKRQQEEGTRLPQHPATTASPPQQEEGVGQTPPPPAAMVLQEASGTQLASVEKERDEPRAENRRHKKQLARKKKQLAQRDEALARLGTELDKAKARLSGQDMQPASPPAQQQQGPASPAHGHEPACLKHSMCHARLEQLTGLVATLQGELEKTKAAARAQQAATARQQQEGGRQAPCPAAGAEQQQQQGGRQAAPTAPTAEPQHPTAAPPARAADAWRVAVEGSGQVPEAEVSADQVAGLNAQVDQLLTKALARETVLQQAAQPHGHKGHWLSFGRAGKQALLAELWRARESGKERLVNLWVRAKGRQPPSLQHPLPPVPQAWLHVDGPELDKLLRQQWWAAHTLYEETNILLAGITKQPSPEKRPLCTEFMDRGIDLAWWMMEQEKLSAGHAPQPRLARPQPMVQPGPAPPPTAQQQSEQPGRPPAPVVAPLQLHQQEHKEQQPEEGEEAREEEPAVPPPAALADPALLGGLPRRVGWGFSKRGLVLAVTAGLVALLLAMSTTTTTPSIPDLGPVVASGAAVFKVVSGSVGGVLVSARKVMRAHHAVPFNQTQPRGTRSDEEAVGQTLTKVELQAERICYANDSLVLDVERADAFAQLSSHLLHKGGKGGMREPEALSLEGGLGQGALARGGRLLQSEPLDLPRPSTASHSQQRLGVMQPKSKVVAAPSHTGLADVAADLLKTRRTAGRWWEEREAARAAFEQESSLEPKGQAEEPADSDTTLTIASPSQPSTEPSMEPEGEAEVPDESAVNLTIASPSQPSVMAEGSKEVEEEEPPKTAVIALTTTQPRATSLSAWVSGPWQRAKAMVLKSFRQHALWWQVACLLLLLRR